MTDTESSVNFRLRREVEGIRGFAQRAWGRWWVKVLAVLAVLIAIAYAVFFTEVCKVGCAGIFHGLRVTGKCVCVLDASVCHRRCPRVCIHLRGQI